MNPRSGTRRRTRLTLGQWSLYAVLVFLVVVVKLQDTRHALLMAGQVRDLWISVGATLVSILILRSGWGRSDVRTEKQLEFGTLQNNFYQPRREVLLQGGAVLGGVAGALWWAVQSWLLLFAGMRRHQAARGLWDFEMSVLVGALAGTVVGATLGLVTGYLWEQWHRRQRRVHR
jgi:hypothetical protein